jgi:hypothetical protein
MAKSDSNATLLLKLTAEDHVLPPDPEEMNKKRSVAALRAVRGFSKDFGENIDPFDGAERVFMVQQNIEDLLADVAHLCDRLGLDLADIVAKSKFHYYEETENEGEQFEFLEVTENGATVVDSL